MVLEVAEVDRDAVCNIWQIPPFSKQPGLDQRATLWHLEYKASGRAHGSD